MPLRRFTRHDLIWYAFTNPTLGSEGRFKHALVTRRGGVSRGAFTSLNLGGSVGDDPARVAENHRRLFEALAVSQDRVVSPHQVHGSRVAEVEADDGGTVIPETDALITRDPGVALLLRFADCVPVLFYDPTHHAAGLAHAGWRGVAARVAPATVRAMVDAFGTRPEDLWAGIGPSIGPDHYAVGPEVVTAVRSALVGGRFADTLPDEPPIAARRARQWYLDLPGAVRMQLRLAGVGAVDLAGICTACDTTAWYSHRAESGKTGRFGVMVMLG